MAVWGLSFFYSVWTYEIVLRRICLLQLYMYALDFFYFFLSTLSTRSKSHKSLCEEAEQEAEKCSASWTPSVAFGSFRVLSSDI